MPAKKRKRPRPAARPAQGGRPGSARPVRPPQEAGGGRRPELYDYQNPNPSPAYRGGGMYRDNTVEFPTGRTRPPARAGGQARPARPAARPARPVQGARPAQRRPAQPVQRREARRRRRVTRRMLRRRRILRRLTAVALVLCVAAAGIYLTMTMLFKINAIRVEGTGDASPYTSQEILDALGVELEENIFSFDPEAKAAQLEKSFPLLEHIAVERVYPSTVVVHVTPATPAYAMPAPGGWISLSKDLKILSSGTQQPADLPVLYGGDPVSVTPGDQLAYAAQEPAASGSEASSSGQEETAPAADNRVQALQTLLAALEERELLADVTRVEFADVEQLAFLYQDRISVLLGTGNELDYKLDYAEYMLLNREGKGCAPTDTGHLDCSHLRTDGSLQAIFAQGSPVLPSGYTVPEAAPALETGAEPAPETGADGADGAQSGAADTGADTEGEAAAGTTQPSQALQEEGL